MRCDIGAPTVDGKGWHHTDPLEIVLLKCDTILLLEVHETSHAPSYRGNETLFGSIWRTLCAPSIVAVVHYGDAQLAEGRDRRAWSEQLRHTVDRLRQS